MTKKSIRSLSLLWISMYTTNAFVPLSLERNPVTTSSTFTSRQFMIPLAPLESLSLPQELATMQLPNSMVNSILAQASSLLASNNIFDAIQSEQSPFQYAFMFPTMVAIATCCQLAGIGGAALLSPVLLLIFPLLGPSYPLQTAASAIASALLTECFGFASGLSGYARRGLVDWGIAFQFAVVSVPSALIGAIAASSLAANPTLLRGVYAVLMIGLALYLTLAEKPDQLPLDEECDISDIGKEGDGLRRINTTDGTPYVYLAPKQGDWTSTGITAGGSGLTGLLGVGVGEVILPQLVRSCCMPLPVAAGTSVAIVVLTALTAAVVQFLTLASIISSSSPDKGILSGLIEVVPWSLVQYTIPGALVGGQVAPYLASRRIFSDDEIERFTASLFGIVGIAFGVKCISG